MSSLTEQERIGLEEVFRSISSQHKHGGKLNRFKEKVTALLAERPFAKRARKPLQLLLLGRKRIKFPNFQHLFPKKNKKKKNLS